LAYPGERGLSFSHRDTVAILPHLRGKKLEAG
jgi:hypothetical protein